jgi:hypothetical protein
MISVWQAKFPVPAPEFPVPLKYSVPQKTDAVAKAQAAWSRFVSCVEALPPAQAAPLWRDAQAQAALRLT